MLSVFKERPSIVVEAGKARFKPHFIIQVIIFVIVFLFIQAAMAIPLLAYCFVYLLSMGSAGITIYDPEELRFFMARFQNELILPSLFCTVLMTILTIFYCRAIEKRSLYSMGFVRKRAFSDYIIGCGIGILMISTSLLIAFLCGTITYEGYVLSDGIGLLFLFLFGFMIQGMGEEVLLRGYFMISVASRNSILLAVISNSVIFAILHIFNNGIAVIPLINLTLFGIFASLYTLKTDSIWGICALHTTWNFVQGNVFGIKVSGIDTKVSLFSFRLKNVGTFINGGSFGLEGGLAVTLVLIMGILILLSMDGRNSEIKSENNTGVRYEEENT